jgi:hypothetical protein
MQHIRDGPERSFFITLLPAGVATVTAIGLNTEGYREVWVAT